MAVEGSKVETAEPCSVVNEQDEISAVEIVAETPAEPTKTPQPDSPVN